MSGVENQNWFLSLGEEIIGPLRWDDLSARVRQAQAQETACVRIENSQAWKPFKLMMTAQPGVVPAEPDPVTFCQVAVRLGGLTQEQARQALELRKVDDAMGRQKPFSAYFLERNLMTAAQIAEVVNQLSAPQSGSDSFRGMTLELDSHLSAGKTAKEKPLRLSTLFPIREWAAQSPWSSGWVRWFAFFVLFPILLSEIMGDNTSLGNVTWALGAYFASLSAIVLYFWLRPASVPPWRLLGIAAFTATMGIILVLLGQELPVVKQMYNIARDPSFVTRLFGSVLGIGIVEEGAKLLPVFWVYAHKGRLGDFRQIVFMGAISGLAFGVTEASQYAYVYADIQTKNMVEAAQATGQIPADLFAGYVVAQSTRMAALPLLHGLFSALSAVFVAFAVRVPARKAGLVLRGWLAAAVLHGAYDASQYPKDPWPWLAIAAGLAALLVFVLYSHTGEAISGRIAAEQAAAGTTAAAA